MLARRVLEQSNKTNSRVRAFGSPSAHAALLLIATLTFASSAVALAQDSFDKLGATPTVFYVTVDGTSTGDGSAQRPWSLAKAFSHPSAVRPGATIWIRGGTYTGAFVSTLSGTAAAPIVVRAYPGERVVIDQNIGTSHARKWTVRGSYTWYWGIEVTDSHPTRTTTQNGSDPTTVPREAATVYALGDHLKFINMTLHDLGDGLSVWESSVETEVYGCITFNNGWNAPDRGHGHGIYTQNNVGTKLIEDVVSFNNFETGMKAFGVNGAVSGYRFDGIVSFNNGSPSAILRDDPAYRASNLLVGSAHLPSDDISVSDSNFYYPVDCDANNVHLGYYFPDCLDVSVTGSTMIRGQKLAFVKDWRSVTFTGNTLWLNNGPKTGPKLISLNIPAGSSLAQYKIDGNSYYDTTPAATNYKSFQYSASPARALTFASWKSQTGLDQTSTYRRSRPTGSRVVVRPNRYETGRAHIVVYNWAGASSVQVDLSSSGLVAGQRFEIHDLQNPLGAPILTGTYTGAPVTVSLAGRAVATPTGMSSRPAHTGPEFFAFLLTPQ